MNDTHPPNIPTLREVEDTHIRHVLELTGYNMTRSAALLGLDRRTLYRRARQAGVEPTRSHRSESALARMRRELESTRAELERIKVERGAL